MLIATTVAEEPGTKVLQMIKNSQLGTHKVFSSQSHPRCIQLWVLEVI